MSDLPDQIRTDILQIEYDIALRRGGAHAEKALQWPVEDSVPAEDRAAADPYFAEHYHAEKDDFDTLLKAYEALVLSGEATGAEKGRLAHIKNALRQVAK